MKAGQRGRNKLLNNYNSHRDLNCLIKALNCELKGKRIKGYNIRKKQNILKEQAKILKHLGVIQHVPAPLNFAISCHVIVSIIVNNSAKRARKKVDKWQGIMGNSVPCSCSARGHLA